MDLTSYAELAVRLVNTDVPARAGRDGLATVDTYRALTADRPYLSTRVTLGDLAALRMLRGELRLIFTAAAGGRHDEVAARLNALLTRHPVHPQIATHDGQAWHLHLDESGSAADQYAAGAVAGLTSLVTRLGASRLGVCDAVSCQDVFIDASTPGSRRYCSDHCTAKATVTAFPGRRLAREAGRASTVAG